MSGIQRAGSSAAGLIRAGRAVAGGAVERYLLTDGQWAALAELLPADPLPLVTLWSDGVDIHALLLDGTAPLIASVAVERQRFLALSMARPSAAIPERIVRDLWGIEAMAARDLRPWLDHGLWPCSAPLSRAPGPAGWPPEPPAFLSVDARAPAQWQVPLGPVQSLTIGPAQFRITLEGETIRSIEPLLGSAHRGVALGLRGLALDAAMPLVARLDAGSSVAHQLAFAGGVEHACGWEIGSETGSLRRGMAALERVSTRLRQLWRLWSVSGAEASARRVLAIRAELAAAIGTAFGHRLMMRSLAPGGWSLVPDAAGLEALVRRLQRLPAELAPLPDALPGQSLLLAIEEDLFVCCNGLSGQKPRPEAVPALPDRMLEGVAEAVSAQGRVWHWVRLEHGLVQAWHAHDPNLDLLDVLVRQAPGRDLDGLGRLCAELGLSVAGADQ